ncbi:hypothetical protein EW146_g3051 [Bondarzewia mesenterica]|uniref:DNA-(apurinic or apyrimidinic site) endonuclease n=1 Tax=Bondarzewia mesenterica TaxID=1095465 RepID=A0A4S4LYS1_9AGAM|nr:hypothetical protein EW146_g3051 [Bondarzewia mesenterica]
MKTTRSTIGRDVALPDAFDSFFSFPASKGGYSGVAVYTKSSTAVPIKAEEGLSGPLQSKPTLTPEERVSPSYPYAHEIDMMEDAEGNTPSDFTSLDSEGRALVLDFGLFVLINLYCPNETSDSRLPFKMNYHFLLQERVRKLVEEEGREVIVVGDINVCAEPIDHCDGHLPSNASTFWEHPARAWFHKWLHPPGPMVDIVRSFWPDRKGMYTCWNTKISARETNYGTRIDYILVTPGLIPWVKHGDIQPSVKGSDHCPVYIDLQDEITLDSGKKVALRDAMKMNDGKRDPPRIAARNWDEYLGKQTLLSSFFGKRDDGKQVPQPTTVFAHVTADTDATASAQIPLAAAFDALHSQQATLEEKPSIPIPLGASSSQTTPVLSTAQTDTPTLSVSEEPPALTPTPPSQTTPTPTPPLTSTTSRPSQSQRKRSRSHETSTSTKSKKIKAGQSKLSSFFSKPSATKNTPKPSEQVLEISDDGSNLGPKPSESSASTPPAQDYLESDYLLACELSASQETENGTSSSSQGQASTSSSKTTDAAWSTLFAPVPPPKCVVHGEPARELRVNKPGPNKGKAFFICSRPVGPGYDKGRNERLREEVDHKYKCNFFKWSSEWKREAMRASSAKKQP